ncbi:MAG: sugar-binding protein [Limnochordia bacterium]|jgi:hypothetical protein|nr:sugar-binding protein [Limnochordia bacterium]
MRKSILPLSLIILLMLSLAPAMAEKNPNRAKAYFFAKPPVIDGELSEWNLANPSLVIGPGSNVMKGDLLSAEDLTLKLYVGWDNDNLYLAVDVKDDSVLGTFDLDDYWSIDRVNFAFDALNNTTSASYATDSPGSGEWEDDDYWVYFQPFGGDEEQGTVVIMNNAKFANIKEKEIHGVRTADGYRCEVRIALTELPELLLKEGAVIGFDVFVTDGDVDDFGILTMSEIMWGGFDYPGGLKWQFWKVGELEFVK